jgi:hypothetical protein
MEIGKVGGLNVGVQESGTKLFEKITNRKKCYVNVGNGFGELLDIG